MRILKLGLELMQYNLEVLWESGKMHLFADSLSWAPGFREWTGFYPIPESTFAQSITHSSHRVNLIPCSTIAESIVDDPSFTDMLAEAKKDEQYQQVAQSVLAGKSKADIAKLPRQP